MAFFIRIWLSFNDERAQAAVDYALAAMVVAFAAVSAVQGLAANVDHALVVTNRNLTAALSACLPHHHG